MSALPEEYISLEAYFELEEASETRHEYYQGKVYDLAGASADHNLITLDIGTSLNVQFNGKSCQPYSTDFRLKIEALKLYTFPDLSVVCGEPQCADGRKDTFTNPTVLIEVLSESTESYDRGKKTEFYRTIPTLQEYLLIAQDRPHVERYRRQGSDWLLSEFSLMEDRVALESIDCILSLSAIYRRVRFDEEQ